jgi:hypothetical protein
MIIDRQVIQEKEETSWSYVLLAATSPPLPDRCHDSNADVVRYHVKNLGDQGKIEQGRGPPQTYRNKHPSTNLPPIVHLNSLVHHPP